jgi:Adenylate and Guanylate cyclase catalytic domain
MRQRYVLQLRHPASRFRHLHGGRSWSREGEVLDLPTGQVTFLFTDIEGSTRLVQSLRSADYHRLLTEHSTLLRAAVRDAGGVEFGTDGDAHFFAFHHARTAIEAATAAQRALAAHQWPDEARIRGTDGDPHRPPRAARRQLRRRGPESGGPDRGGRSRRAGARVGRCTLGGRCSLRGAEVPNVRSALRWAIDSGDPADLETGLLMAGALWRFWQLTGTLREAAEWFDQLLARPNAAEIPAARAKALRGAGGIAYWQNDLPEGQYERAVRLWAAAQAIKERIGGGAPSEMMQTVDPRPAAIEALGEDAVAQAWIEGQAMTPEGAVAYALGGDVHSADASRASDPALAESPSGSVRRGT